MTSGWHLAQCNIARLLLPFDDPRLGEFFAELARVNAIADEAPGFVWRLQDESGDATALAPTPDPQVALNMTRVGRCRRRCSISSIAARTRP